MNSEALKNKKGPGSEIGLQGTPNRKEEEGKAVVFPVVMYGCESWIIKKADRM